MAIIFYPFLYPRTDSPEEEKLNVVVNKATLLRTLGHYLPTIPPPPPSLPCLFKNNADILISNI